MCMHHMHVVPEEARRGQQVPLELGLQLVESHHVGTWELKVGGFERGIVWNVELVM